MILGTVAVENPELMQQLCEAYPGKIAVGIDARNGKVATRGWLQTSSLDAVQLAKQIPLPPPLSSILILPRMAPWKDQISPP